MEQSLAAVRKEFPGATVKTSTFDAFIADVLPEKDTLPVVSLEVGDTWVYGNPSDPLKMAQFRALQRVWIECKEAGKPECQTTNPVIQNFTWALLKAPGMMPCSSLYTHTHTHTHTYAHAHTQTHSHSRTHTNALTLSLSLSLSLSFSLSLLFLCFALFCCAGHVSYCLTYRYPIIS